MFKLKCMFKYTLARQWGVTAIEIFNLFSMGPGGLGGAAEAADDGFFAAGLDVH